MLSDFYSLLHYSLYGGNAPRLSARPDWAAILRQARRQTVMGLIAEAIGNLPPDKQPPEEMIQKMRIFMIRNIHQHGQLNARIGEVCTHLRAHGIDGVVLKGQGVAGYYQKPETRQCGDIDLYIGLDRFEQALRLCVDRWQDGKQDNQQTYKHYGFDIGDIEVELHREAAICQRFWKRKAFRAWQREMLGDPSRLRKAPLPDGGWYYVPGVEFDAVYIFYHMLVHFTVGEGVGLRQLCDWAMVLDRAEAEGLMPAVEARVRGFGLQRPWSILLEVARKATGDSTRPLSKRAARLEAIILEGGNFGTYSANRAPAKRGYWHGKWVTWSIMLKNVKKMYFLSPADVLGGLTLYTFSGFFRAIGIR